MKFLLISVSILLINSVTGQKGIPTFKEYPDFSTKLIFWDNSASKKGYIISANEQGLTMVDKNQYLSVMFQNQPHDLETIPFPKIKTIQFYKKGKTGRSILVFAGIAAAATGTAFAIANEPCSSKYCLLEFSDEAAFFLGSITGALGGALIGLILSPLPSVKISINGSYDEYRKHQKKIDKYLN